jgi:ParB family chromosome partitioning protein
VVEQDLSVRRTEEIIATLKQGSTSKAPNGAPQKSSANKYSKELAEAFQPLKRHLSDRLEAEVSLVFTEKGSGKITVAFTDEEDLEKLILRFDALLKK